jgi:lipase maturation factor 1
MDRSFVIGRWLFFRGLALSYLFGFASLGFQMKGLYGERGILPVAPYLEAVANNLGAARFWRVPTIFWVSASDSMLVAVCWIGALAAVALAIGLWHRPLLFLCWFLFLSISTVGRDFLSFQWDILLLEVGLASLLIAPPGFFPKLAADRPPPRLGLLVLNVVLFKLMFSSGFVKLSSGDETWRSLTALLYHYETQPLPTWIGWWAHQLPDWFQRFSVIGVFWIQLAMPFGIFFPRPVRLISAAALLGLQALIALTGNYCYFNLLAVSLIALVIDDAVFARFVRFSIVEVSLEGIRRRILIAAVSLLLVLNVLTVARTLADDLPDAVHELLGSFRQFRSVSGYGLFAVMTTVRREIVIEGSFDGQQWLEYQLPHQPGPLDRAPSFVAPHQPRLDWQMWFAALGSARRNLWFGRLMVRLLEGSDDVRGLFAKDPFPDEPPRFIRARFYRYWFSDLETKRTTGRWWERELIGDYLPAFSLEDVTR